MKFFKKLLAISFASITLVSCGSKPNSISCNTTSSFWFSGAKLSYSINTNKIVINSVDPDTGKPYKVTIPIQGDSIKIFNETFKIFTVAILTMFSQGLFAIQFIYFNSKVSVDAEIYNQIFNTEKKYIDN